MLILSSSASYARINKASDNLIDADQEIVIVKTVQLVFQNYPDKVDSLTMY
jgi:hypothetical protein